MTTGNGSHPRGFPTGPSQGRPWGSPERPNSCPTDFDSTEDSDHVCKEIDPLA